MAASNRILIVDDNKSYRSAFGRNLKLHGYRVEEAEDSVAAIEKVQVSPPDVVVTDLAMRHPTEGLDLIRQIRALQPHLPLIMISAVGTFDEGAEAMRLGAWRVISKSRIDEELQGLYEAIDDAARHHALAREGAERLHQLREKLSENPQSARTELNEIMRKEDVPDSIKREAFEWVAELSAESASEVHPSRQAFQHAARDVLEKVEAALKSEIKEFDGLDPDSRENLRTAEFLYQQSNSGAVNVDFSRSMGFAYCFAVENEAKARLRKKFHKFLDADETIGLIRRLLEPDGKSISIFYQQHLLRAQQGLEMEVTMDNFHHTFMRILEHQGRYKPDGLKALGIMLICFGRTYKFRKMTEDIEIDNPLDLRGFDDPQEVLNLAGRLINLQHYRNPYIHPEISEMTKLSRIRSTAFECLNQIVRIQ